MKYLGPSFIHVFVCLEDMAAGKIRMCLSEFEKRMEKCVIPVLLTRMKTHVSLCNDECSAVCMAANQVFVYS